LAVAATVLQRERQCGGGDGSLTAAEVAVDGVVHANVVQKLLIRNKIKSFLNVQS
jgi:hypothetical protein